MGNQYELKFEKTITAMILSDNNSDLSQVDLFMDFHRNSGTYYDNFCDALYELSSGQTTLPLWITPSGDFYLSALRQDSFDKQVLTHDKIPEFYDDLYDQLEAALVHIWNLHTN